MHDGDRARRFGGLDRLYGPGAVDALGQLHVLVAGIGGVGSWAAEALARSGVGSLGLVDMDHVAVSNINRQIHALDNTLGLSKVQAMAARIHGINPLCRVHCVDDFVSPENVAAIFAGFAAQAGTAARLVLLDCTDQVPAKQAMILQARAAGWAVLACGGAGGKTDPLSLRLGDLSLARHDALLGRVRQGLRRHHGYPRGGEAAGKPRKKPPRMGVHCLWFDQAVVLPEAWQQARAQAGGKQPPDDRAGISSHDGGQPETGQALQGLSCAGYGSAVTITATMGMAAADWALQQGLRPASPAVRSKPAMQPQHASQPG